jgi:hypothetical protein
MANGMQDVDDKKFFLPTNDLPDSGRYTLAVRSDISKYIIETEGEDNFILANVDGLADKSGGGFFYCLPGVANGTEDDIIVTKRFMKTINGQSLFGEQGNIDVGGSSNFMTNITYEELKSLRDSGNLIPGMQYRITDYVTTTAQA